MPREAVNKLFKCASAPVRACVRFQACDRPHAWTELMCEDRARMCRWVTAQWHLSQITEAQNENPCFFFFASPASSSKIAWKASILFLLLPDANLDH